VGIVSLSVADLERSLAFYTEAIGLTLLESSASVATLGVAGRPLLVLREQPGAEAWPRGGRSYTGLYHFAILLPTRADLGLWLRNWLDLGMPMPGQGYHLVSEALYLEDPDMHGIEVYRDRPRDEWQWEGGQVRMASDPVDIQGILDDAERSGRTWEGLPEGTFVGHIHLQVGDIPQAEAFYHGALGFDIIARMPTALFMSAGGYHHHIGMNIWHSRGAEPAPADSVRLRYFTIDLATPEALAAVVGRLDAAGIEHSDRAGTIVVQDPWQTTLLLQVGHAADARAAAALEGAVGVR
jgi:catechol 2,3-dioxygenase